VSHNAGTECPSATASEKKSNIGVPEPANRAFLLIAAFELIGTSMRRRKTIPPGHRIKHCNVAYGPGLTLRPRYIMKGGGGMVARDSVSSMDQRVDKSSK